MAVGSGAVVMVSSTERASRETIGSEQAFYSRIDDRAARDARQEGAATTIAAMGGVLRLLLIATAVGLVVMLLFRPAQIGRLGARARTVGYAYVAAILISAALRLLFGWGT